MYDASVAMLSFENARSLVIRRGVTGIGERGVSHVLSHVLQLHCNAMLKEKDQDRARERESALSRRYCASCLPDCMYSTVLSRTFVVVFWKDGDPTQPGDSPSGFLPL